MLFKNYQVFVFDEKSGKKRSFTIKSSLFVYLFACFVIVAGASGYFIQHYPEESYIGGIESDEFKVDMLPLHRQELASRKILSYIRDLKKDSQLEEIIQQDLIVYMNESTQKLAAIPSIIPSQGFITSRFGHRTSPFTGTRKLHKGLDIAAVIGTKIIAPADGKVVFAQRDGAYGLSVEVDHGNGIITRYAHMSKINVKRGDAVKRGSLIGLVGNTGRSTGAHLHYEVIVNGVHTDPMAYIIEK